MLPIKLYLKNNFDKGYICLIQRKLMIYLFDNRYLKKELKKDQLRSGKMVHQKKKTKTNFVLNTN